MNASAHSDIFHRHRSFFLTNQTLSLPFRRCQLECLRDAIRGAEASLLQALRTDLGKPEYEAFLSELSPVYEEIRFALRNLSGWARPQRAASPWLLWPSRSYIHSEPLGVVLIIGPWNYPFQLLFSPLVGAIAAGNGAVLKPSEYAPATSEAIAELVKKNFDPGFLSVQQGGVELSQALLQMPFDHIFFTGGTEVGKVVMSAAAKNLVPVTLELGGKSPCIVDQDVNLEVTARRIAWGKCFNAGQTCVAPDYVLVPHGLRDPLVQKLKETIDAFYGPEPQGSPDYARIVNDRHFDRLVAYLSGKTPVVGGQHEGATRYLAPTILVDVDPKDAVMQEEIFGPILPVLSYQDFDEAIAFVKNRPKPLALYLFSSDPKNQRRVLNELSFGGGCLNDTLVHLTSPTMPFGGVGPSGMGAYHGRHSFEVFSHRKSILRKPFWGDWSLRYPPYRNRLKRLKTLFR